MSEEEQEKLKNVSKDPNQTEKTFFKKSKNNLADLFGSLTTDASKNPIVKTSDSTKIERGMEYLDPINSFLDNINSNQPGNISQLKEKSAGIRKYDELEVAEYVRSLDPSTLEDNRANKWLTCRALEIVLHGYAYTEHLDKVDFEKLGFASERLAIDNGRTLLEKVFAKSEGRFRMYGSVDELIEKLRLFRKFHSSHRYFSMDKLDAYNHSYDKYVANESDYYYAKQDLYVKLQSDIFEKFEELRTLPRRITVIYLKNMEEHLQGTLEYVSENDQKATFDAIKKKIEKGMENIKLHAKKPVHSKRKNKLGTLRPEKKNATFNDIFDDWKNFLPDSWTQAQMDPVEEAIHSYLECNPIATCAYKYTEVYYTSVTLVELLTDIFESYPHIYLPYAKTNVQKPIVLRVFNDDRLNYIVCDELADVIRQRHEDKIGDNFVIPSWFPLFITMDLETLLTSYKNGPFLDNVVLAFTKVNRQKKVAPILMPTGEYVFPTGYIFNDVLRKLILGMQIFQRFSKEKAGEAMGELMRNLCKTFHPTQRQLHFIACSAIDQLSEELEDFFAAFDERPVEEVPAFPDGSSIPMKTVRDIVCRLVSQNVFPSRDANLRAVCTKVLRSIGTPLNFKVKHLYDVLEQVQTECFLQQCPQLILFLHLQKCSHDSDHCQYC